MRKTMKLMHCGLKHIVLYKATITEIGKLESELYTMFFNAFLQDKHSSGRTSGFAFHFSLRSKTLTF